MSQSSTWAIEDLYNLAEPVNLTNCDREPIHIPGSIQPHGLLLVLSEPDFCITQVSENASDILGITPENLLNYPFTQLCDRSCVDAIIACLDRSFEHVNPLRLSIPTETGVMQSFNGIVHRAISGEIVLELEPLEPTAESDFFQFYRQIKGTLTKIQMTTTLTDLCNLIVKDIRRITGFDRVMIYRFDDQGNGTVIAEDKQPELEAFLGMHYPDSDIPKQAKHLYSLNWLRLIPDVNYQPQGLLTRHPLPTELPAELPTELPTELPADSPIESSAESSIESLTDSPIESLADSPIESLAESPFESDSGAPSALPDPDVAESEAVSVAEPASCSNATGAFNHTPLDMSYCSLRSVSPIHLEYLKNMEVVASMSVSLMQQQRLWGLIACHHNTPKFVPYEIRTICEFLGQLMSTELVAKEGNENLDYKLHLKSIQGHLIEHLAKTNHYLDVFNAMPEVLMELTGATGVAVYEGDSITEDKVGHLTLMGNTPSQEDVLSLIGWLPNQFEQDLFVTDSLPLRYPPAHAYKEVASGVLALAISKIHQRYVLWFRPEFLQTVTWAGNPVKPRRVEADGSLTIFPRQSFEAWQELVRLKSAPWLPCETEGAIELRQAIVDIVLRQANELATINLELERSNSELDAFAYIASHDLKEPLRGIHNYATFLLEDYGEILREDGAEKLNTLVRLSQRMESLIESLLKFSRLGRQELVLRPIDLNSLLHDATEVFRINPQWVGCEIRVPQPLPTILGDRVLVEEIFINLISNAFKYNDHTEKWVEIGCRDPSDRTDGKVTIYIKDNGIGIREKHLESVFRIFKRLHAVGKYGGGTGAGLTITKKIVERHGGTIKVESIYGQGSTFLLTLPGSSSETSVNPS